MRRIDETLATTLNRAHHSFNAPAIYIHSLIMSTELFVKLWSNEIIDFEYYNIDDTIHYQESNGIINLGFTSARACNEVQIKALEYFIRIKTGIVPILRSENKTRKTKNLIYNGNRSE